MVSLPVYQFKGFINMKTIRLVSDHQKQMEQILDPLEDLVKMSGEPMIGTQHTVCEMNSGFPDQT